MSPVARAKPAPVAMTERPATDVTTKTASLSQPLLVVGAIGSNRSQHLSFIKRTASLIVFLSLINALVTNPITDSQTTKGCFQCFDLMNRRWRSDTPGQCFGTKDDCGKCIEGYHANSNDEKCQPSEKITVEKSGISLIPNGSIAVIKCGFQEKCDCSWSRRDYALDIGGRYNFQEGNGLETKICSIIIDPVIFPIDHGLWECTSMADSMHVAKTSTAVILTSDKIITVDENDTNAYVPSGETVIIHCHFNKIVDCAWERRTHAVEIKGRYGYLTNDGGISTTDCSIKISLFTEIDTGLWNCRSMADSSNSAIQSTQVQILQAIMPTMTVAPQNITAMEGDNVVLNCEFDAEVDCSWQKDGVPVVMDNQYQFTENPVQRVQTRRNCSLTITTVRKSDVGRWACKYAGNINSRETANSAWLTIKPLEKPSLHYINLRTATGLYNCSNDLVIREGSSFACTSENGNPAPKLRWTLEGLDFAPDNITTNGANDVFNVTISLNYSLHKNQFKIGWNALKCIATHPAIEEELSTQVDILVIEDQPKVRRSLMNSGQATGSERAICCQDAQSYMDMQGSNSRRNDVSRQITAAAMVLVLSIYLLTQ